MAVSVIYLWYHAYIIAVTAVGAEHRFRLFFRMLYNPFWRTLEQSLLKSQSSEFKAYVSRIERAKYLFVAGAILLGMTLAVLDRSDPTGFFLIPLQAKLRVHDAAMLYVAVGVAYWLYQAYRMTSDVRLRLFLRMSSNPFWRVFEREALAPQDHHFKSYMLRLEVLKYCYLMGLIILIIASTIWR